MALLDPTNATVMWPALPSVLLVPNGNSESKVVLRRKKVPAEAFTSVSEFPGWCLTGFKQAK